MGRDPEKLRSGPLVRKKGDSCAETRSVVLPWLGHPKGHEASQREGNTTLTTVVPPFPILPYQSILIYLLNPYYSYLFHSSIPYLLDLDSCLLTGRATGELFADETRHQIGRGGAFFWTAKPRLTCIYSHLLLSIHIYLFVSIEYLFLFAIYCPLFCEATPKLIDFTTAKETFGELAWNIPWETSFFSLTQNTNG